jgi:hypothetical protein
MCERSLVAMVDLFEKLRFPTTAQYAVFVVNLKMRRKATKEITSDFTHPVEMCLQPDLHDINAAMTSTIHNLVNASRNFNRYVVN